MTTSIPKEIPTSRLSAAITAADNVDSTLKSFVYRPADYASQLTSAVSGPLAGVPIAIKDLIDTADMPTTYGSRTFQDHQPTKDAWVVAKLREAGAIIFGKTVTTEFAWRDAGPTVNPWNTAHSPGGSSSGSAAAVGAGIVDIALGTQTVGSVIRPASYCGAYGYKPTFGLIPTDGVHDLAVSLDHLGFIISDLYWAAVCHAIVVRNGAITEPSSLEQFATGVKPRKLGVYRSSRWPYVQSDVQQNFEGVIRRLETQGVECVPVDFPDDFSTLNALTNKILAFEANIAIDNDIKGREEMTGAYTRDLVAYGKTINRQEYEALLIQLGDLRSARDNIFADIDAMMTVTSPTTALKGLEKTGDASFCMPATLLGLPAVSVPSGFSPDFLPYGLQLIGRGNDDLALINVAQWVSTLLPKLTVPAMIV
ncbi:Glutamyl-tRNA(Gln) amidotransferase subunit A [Serratia proteamaculans]|uniref:amidase n=1 Tax=Serratia proteamaculans TaxID=28151 RepID=UPI0021833400|nr:amidase [Serratia proteamaculans]CAI2534707.1 Glutamyl-tRNA(Gln) amidotransferase subunit A [Serratia proteamaculans]